MKRILFILLCTICVLATQAQDRYMRVHQLDGTVTKFAVNTIDSIDFVTNESNYYTISGRVLMKTTACYNGFSNAGLAICGKQDTCFLVVPSNFCFTWLADNKTVAAGDSVIATGAIDIIECEGQQYSKMTVVSIQIFPMESQEITIRGIIQLTGNACTTIPCESGVDLAVISDKYEYFIANQHTEENKSIDTNNDGVADNNQLVFHLCDKTFINGDSVIVSGTATPHFDIQNDRYYILGINEINNLN